MIILASASPRRQEILKLITENFIVIPSDIDEGVPNNIETEKSPEYLAVKKAKHIYENGHKNDVVIGCICGNSKVNSFSQVTEVEFYELTEEEIESYIATGEPMDKAGSYGIQGKGSLLVKGIVGDYFNVVGLPVARLNKELNG